MLKSFSLIPTALPFNAATHPITTGFFSPPPGLPQPGTTASPHRLPPSVPWRIVYMYSIKNPPANAGDERDTSPWVRKIPWSRKWQPTPVFSPGKFHGQRNLAGYSPLCVCCAQSCPTLCNPMVSYISCIDRQVLYH